jgi:hypothetical protein
MHCWQTEHDPLHVSATTQTPLLHTPSVSGVGQVLPS